MSRFVAQQRTQYLEILFPEGAPPEEQDTIKIWYWKVTRGMRQRAVDKATMAYYVDNRHLPPEERVGFYPSVLERELAVQSIKKWNLPGTPAQNWDLIDPPQLGDLIVRKLDLTGQATGTKAVEEGKNSHPGGGDATATSSPPSTSSTTSSSTPGSTS